MSTALRLNRLPNVVANRNPRNGNNNRVHSSRTGN
jgi:hypothetical protein